MTSTPKLTSREIIAAYYRLGDLMDEGGDPTTTSERQEEIDEEAIELFERLGDEAPDKLEALRSVAIHAEGEARMLRDEERRLAQRRRAREKLVTRLKSYAGQVLAARRLAGQDPKIKTAAHTFWLQSSTSLQAPEELPAWEEQGWIKTKVEPDRAAARKALKSGTEAQGFELVEQESIRWR